MNILFMIEVKFYVLTVKHEFLNNMYFLEDCEHIV